MVLPLIIGGVFVVGAGLLWTFREPVKKHLNASAKTQEMIDQDYENGQRSHDVYQKYGLFGWLYRGAFGDNDYMAVTNNPAPNQNPNTGTRNTSTRRTNDG